CRSCIFSKVCCDFYFVYFLTEALIRQGTILTFFWTSIFYCFIFWIKTIVTIGMFPETCSCEVFIKTSRFWLVPFIISNYRLMTHSMYLGISRLVIIPCIHGLIPQSRKRYTFMDPF